MKAKFYTTILGIIMLGLLAGCKSASKMYEKGNYDEAVELAAKKLQKKPGDPELISIIQNAYQYAIRDHETRISRLKASQQEMKDESIYLEYASLQRLHDAIFHSPEVMKVVTPVDYSRDMAVYADRTANAYRERAYYFMNRGDKASFQNAYHDLNRALAYRPGDVELLESRDEAYENALVHVVIRPVSDGNNFRFSSFRTPETRNLEDNIIRSLQNNSSFFVKYHNAAAARSLNIFPDRVIDLQLNRLESGRVREFDKKREVSKEVVIKETVYRPDSVVKEYGRVKAIITETRRELEALGSLQIVVRDGNGRRLWSDEAQAQYHWSTFFASFRGDERALSEADKKILNQRPEFTPTERAVAECLLEDLERTVVHRIRQNE